MTTMTAPLRTVKPTPADLATMYLRDRGYDAATIQAARYDESIISPADAAAVQRIITQACTPAPAVLTDRYTAECATEAAHRDGRKMHEARRAAEHLGDNFALLAPVALLREIGPGLSAEVIDDIIVSRLVRDGAASRVSFPEPSPDDAGEAADDAALTMAATGFASVRPDVQGVGLVAGLDDGERAAVLTASTPLTEGVATPWSDRTERQVIAAQRLALRRVLADRPRLDPIPPAPVSPIGDISARCPECGTRTDDGPCVICDGWFAPAFGLSPAPFALPAPICGGSHDAEPVTFETRCEGGAWVVTRDGRTAFRSRYMVPARADMQTRAQAEADRDGVSVVALFHQPGRPVVGQTFAPRPTERSAADYLMPAEVARALSAASIVGHDA